MLDITLVQFLVWLISGPGVGVATNWLVEYIPGLKRWLDTLDYEWRRGFYMVVSLVIPLVATGGMVWLDQAEPTPETWFKALAAGALGYMTNQATYLLRRAYAVAHGKIATFWAVQG